MEEVNLMEKVIAPWWVSIWPLLNIILMIAFLFVAIFFMVKVFKFVRLGIIVFNDYLEKNRK